MTNTANESREMDGSRPAAEDIVLYEKDPKTKVATITLNRPDALNAPTVAARVRYAELLQHANVDDDVKVLVIRGVGEHFGGGADLPEEADMLSADGTAPPPLHTFEFGDADVAYPPRGSYRYLATLTQRLANVATGCRTLQEFKKISIVEAKGYCYGWHFYQAGDADLLISSDDALFGHPSFRYVGWAPRMWTWAQMMGLRKFQEMVFTGRPFTAKEMYDCNFINSMVPRDSLEAEVERYALACARSRPSDTIFMQKTFFEIMKQQQGEYLGSILSAWLESMGPMVRPDDDRDLMLDADVFDDGLNNAVKNNDSQFPAEWRLSHGGRANREG